MTSRLRSMPTFSVPGDLQRRMASALEKAATEEERALIRKAALYRWWSEVPWPEQQTILGIERRPTP